MLPDRVHVKTELLTFSQAYKIFESRWRATPEEIRLWLAFGASGGRALDLFSRVDPTDCPDSSCQCSPTRTGAENPAYLCVSRVDPNQIERMKSSALDNFLLKSDQVEAFTPEVEDLASCGGVQYFTAGPDARGEQFNPSGRYVSCSDAIKFLSRYASSEEGAIDVLNAEYRAGALVAFKPYPDYFNGVLWSDLTSVCPPNAHFYEGQILGLAARTSNSTITRWDAISCEADVSRGANNDSGTPSQERLEKFSWLDEVVKFCQANSERLPRNHTAKYVFHILSGHTPLTKLAPPHVLELPACFKCKQEEPEYILSYIHGNTQKLKRIAISTFENNFNRIKKRSGIPNKTKENPVRL